MQPSSSPSPSPATAAKPSDSAGIRPTGPALAAFGQPLDLRPETPFPDGKLSFALVQQDRVAYPGAVVYDPVSLVIKMDLASLQACIDSVATGTEGPVPAIGRACASVARAILGAANSVFRLTGAVGFVGMAGLVVYLMLRTFGLFAWILIAMWAQPFVLAALLIKLLYPDRRSREFTNLQQAIHTHLSSGGFQ